VRLPDLSGIKAPVLLIHGGYDRVVAFVKLAEWTPQVLAFLKGY
jgi:alpha-beta hydrolase superfamily lysophospholipase